MKDRVIKILIFRTQGLLAQSKLIQLQIFSVGNLQLLEVGMSLNSSHHWHRQQLGSIPSNIKMLPIHIKNEQIIISRRPQL